MGAAYRFHEVFQRDSLDMLCAQHGALAKCRLELQEVATVSVPALRWSHRLQVE
jgi:hypothetical protein